MISNDLARRDFKDLKLTFTESQLSAVNDMMTGYRLVKILMARPLSSKEIGHIFESKQAVKKAVEKFETIDREYIETTLYTEYIVFENCEIIIDEYNNTCYYLFYLYDKINNVHFEMIFRRSDSLIFQLFDEINNKSIRNFS